MIGINQVMGSVISGCAVSCGAVLAVAGASKLYRGMRGLDDMTATRRALRMPGRQWRLSSLTEPDSRWHGVRGGRSSVQRRVPGAGRRPPGRPRGDVLRSARLRAHQAGSRRPRVYQVARSDRNGGRSANLAGNGPQRNAARRRRRVHGGLNWCRERASPVLFGAGVVAGTTVLVLLSMPKPVRTPVCRRPLWRKTRTTLRALASHESFAAMADSTGPFGPVARYRRTGCTDEFWFTVPACAASQAVVFQVNRAAPGARLAVHISLRDVPASGASWPARTITVAHVLPEVPRGIGSRDYPRSPKRLAPTAAGWTPAAPTSGADVSAADCGAPSSQAGKPRTNGERRYEVSRSP